MYNLNFIPDRKNILMQVLNGDECIIKKNLDFGFIEKNSTPEQHLECIHKTITNLEGAIYSFKNNGHFDYPHDIGSTRCFYQYDPNTEQFMIDFEGFDLQISLKLTEKSVQQFQEQLEKLLNYLKSYYEESK
jgi:hypothetical protein